MTAKRRELRGLLLCGAYALAALIPITVGVFRPGITGYKRALLEDMVYSRAYQPFVRRQLVPLVVRGTMALMPGPLKQRLVNSFSKSSLVERLGWPPAYAPEFVVTLVVMYGSMIGFLVVLRSLLLGCLDMPSPVAHTVVLAVCVGLPTTFAGKLYIYDPMQLFVFTGALVCLLRQRWPLFYPVFALACVNKETSLLVPLIFVCWLGRDVLKPPNVARLAMMAIGGLAICVTLAWTFRDNPGPPAEWHLQRNLGLPFTMLGWIRVGILAAAIGLAVSRLRAAPKFLSRGLLATLPVLLLSTFFLGYIDELRNLYEALPFLIGLVLLALGRALGVRPLPQPGS